MTDPDNWLKEATGVSKQKLLAQIIGDKINLLGDLWLGKRSYSGLSRFHWLLSCMDDRCCSHAKLKGYLICQSQHSLAMACCLIIGLRTKSQIARQTDWLLSTQISKINFPQHKCGQIYRQCMCKNIWILKSVSTSAVAGVWRQSCCCCWSRIFCQQQRSLTAELTDPETKTANLYVVWLTTLVTMKLSFFPKENSMFYFSVVALLSLKWMEQANKTPTNRSFFEKREPLLALLYGIITVPYFEERLH